MQELFENTSIKRAYFTLAIPVVLNMVVTLCYNMVDTFFVSQTQNANLVAGVSQGAPLFTLMIAIGDIFGLGGSSVISRLFGEHRYEEGRRVSAYCFWAPIFVGIGVAILMLIFTTPFLKLLGATSATWKYARQYYLVLAVGSPFIIFFFSPVNILRTEGLAVESMKASIIGTVINIILNPIFIFACGLGAAGSALATDFGNAIGDVLMVYYLRTKSTHLSTSIHEAKVSPALKREVYAIGIPASVTNVMATFATTMTNRALDAYGSAAVAAMGIAQKLSTITSMIFSGFAFGSQPLIGYSYGAKDRQRFNRVIALDLTVIITIAVTLGLVIFIFAPTIITWFMHDPSVIKHGALMIRWLVVSAPLAGLILGFTTIFQSMGKAVPAFILSFCRQGLIFWLALETLRHLFGYTGILASQATSDVICAVMAIILFLHYRLKPTELK